MKEGEEEKSMEAHQEEGSGRGRKEGKGGKGAQEKFQKVQEAYELIQKERGI